MPSIPLPVVDEVVSWPAVENGDVITVRLCFPDNFAVDLGIGDMRKQVIRRVFSPLGAQRVEVGVKILQRGIPHPGRRRQVPA